MLSKVVELDVKYTSGTSIKQIAFLLLATMCDGMSNPSPAVPAQPVVAPTRDLLQRQTELMVWARVFPSSCVPYAYRSPITLVVEIPSGGLVDCTTYFGHWRRHTTLSASADIRVCTSVQHLYGVQPEKDSMWFKCDDWNRAMEGGHKQSWWMFQAGLEFFRFGLTPQSRDRGTSTQLLWMTMGIIPTHYTPIPVAHHNTPDSDTGTTSTLTDDTRCHWGGGISGPMETKITEDFGDPSIWGLQQEDQCPCLSVVMKSGCTMYYHKRRGIWEAGTIYGL